MTNASSADVLGETASVELGDMTAELGRDALTAGQECQALADAVQGGDLKSVRSAYDALAATVHDMDLTLRLNRVYLDDPRD
jgi:hypothetical protein